MGVAFRRANSLQPLEKLECRKVLYKCCTGFVSRRGRSGNSCWVLKLGDFETPVSIAITSASVTVPSTSGNSASQGGHGQEVGGVGVGGWRIAQWVESPTEIPRRNTHTGSSPRCSKSFFS